MRKIFTYIWILVISFLAISLESPTKVASEKSNGFSAINTEPHIQSMAAQNHFMGTSENRKVRDYILSEFEKLQIQTEVFVGITDRNYNNRYIKLARTENIIATIKGTDTGNLNRKAVLIAGHYDSVLSAPGAADDVHAVACMLETAKLLKQKPHKNDIIFLITDGEEMGLFGAKSFVEQKENSNIGLVLNYEARGNSGPSISFEWSEGNAWLVSQVKKAGKKPIANSLSYEVYNLLPNDTDFTFFKKAGLAGINHAFIDGFSYYHNPDDTYENLNMESVQHTGENMYHLTEHFANSDLSNVVSHNASFFNVFTYLVIYPSTWNLFLLLFTALLIVVTIYKLYVLNSLKIKSILWALVSLIFILVVVGVSMKLLGGLLFAVYPQYEVFYAGQFYNHKIYIFTTVSIAVLVTSLVLYWYKRENDFKNIKVASLVILLCFTLVFYIFLPTATYFMSIPTLILTSGLLLNIKFQKDIYRYTLPFLVIIIPLSIWVPVVNTLFLAFSISNMIGPAILTFIICLGLILTFEDMWKSDRVLPFISIAIICVSMVWAHLTSQPTTEKPLPSSLIYHYNIDTDISHWISNDDISNIGNQEYFDDDFVEVNIPYKVTKLGIVNDVKPFVKTKVELGDTMGNFDFKLTYDDEVFQTRIYIENVENVKSFNVNDERAFVKGDSKGKLTMEIYGLTQDSLQLGLTKIDEGKEVELHISSRFLGLPVKDILPDNAVRQDGYIEIVRTVRI